MTDDKHSPGQEHEEFDAHFERAVALAQAILCELLPTLCGNPNAPADAIVAHMIVVATLARLLDTDLDNTITVLRAVWTRTMLMAVDKPAGGTS